MSKDWYQDVVEFHKATGSYIGEGPEMPPSYVRLLRCRLVREEMVETLNALQRGDLVELVDGVADSIVVLLGTLISYGIDVRPIWDEIHRTNMLKVGGPVREDGKILKPEGWQPPRVAELLEAQGKRYDEEVARRRETITACIKTLEEAE